MVFACGTFCLPQRYIILHTSAIHDHSIRQGAQRRWGPHPHEKKAISQRGLRPIPCPHQGGGNNTRGARAGIRRDRSGPRWCRGTCSGTVRRSAPAVPRDCPGPSPQDLLDEGVLGTKLGNLNGMNSHVVDDARCSQHVIIKDSSKASSTRAENGPIHPPIACILATV